MKPLQKDARAVRSATVLLLALLVASANAGRLQGGAAHRHLLGPADPEEFAAPPINSEVGGTCVKINLYFYWRTESGLQTDCRCKDAACDTSACNVFGSAELGVTHDTDVFKCVQLKPSSGHIVGVTKCTNTSAVGQTEPTCYVGTTVFKSGQVCLQSGGSSNWKICSVPAFTLSTVAPTPTLAMAPVTGSANIDATYGYKDCDDTFWNYKANSLSLGIETSLHPTTTYLTGLTQLSTTTLKFQTLDRVMDCMEKDLIMYEQTLTGTVEMTFQPKKLCTATLLFGCFDPATSSVTVSAETTYQVTPDPLPAALVNWFWRPQDLSSGWAGLDDGDTVTSEGADTRLWLSVQEGFSTKYYKSVDAAWTVIKSYTSPDVQGTLTKDVLPAADEVDHNHRTLTLPADNTGPALLKELIATRTDARPRRDWVVMFPSEQTPNVEAQLTLTATDVCDTARDPSTPVAHYYEIFPLTQAAQPAATYNTADGSAMGDDDGTPTVVLGTPLTVTCDGWADYLSSTGYFIESVELVVPPAAPQAGDGVDTWTVATTPTFTVDGVDKANPEHGSEVSSSFRYTEAKTYQAACKVVIRDPFAEDLETSYSEPIAIEVTAPAFTVTPTFVSSTGASLPKDDEDNDNAYATQHLKLSASSESTTEGLPSCWQVTAADLTTSAYTPTPNTAAGVTFPIPFTGGSFSAADAAFSGALSSSEFFYSVDTTTTATATVGADWSCLGDDGESVGIDPIPATPGTATVTVHPLPTIEAYFVGPTVDEGSTALLKVCAHIKQEWTHEVNPITIAISGSTPHASDTATCQITPTSATVSSTCPTNDVDDGWKDCDVCYDVPSECKADNFALTAVPACEADQDSIACLPAPADVATHAGEDEIEITDVCATFPQTVALLQVDAFNMIQGNTAAYTFAIPPIPAGSIADPGAAPEHYNAIVELVAPTGATAGVLQTVTDFNTLDVEDRAYELVYDAANTRWTVSATFPAGVTITDGNYLLRYRLSEPDASTESTPCITGWIEPIQQQNIKPKVHGQGLIAFWPAGLNPLKRSSTTPKTDAAQFNIELKPWNAQSLIKLDMAANDFHFRADSLDYNVVQIGERGSPSDKGRRVIATGTGFVSGVAVTGKKGGSDKKAVKFYMHAVAGNLRFYDRIYVKIEDADGVWFENSWQAVSDDTATGAPYLKNAKGQIYGVQCPAGVCALAAYNSEDLPAMDVLLWPVMPGSGIFTDNNAGGNKSRRMAAEEAPVLATEVATAAVTKKANNRRMRQ